MFSISLCVILAFTRSLFTRPSRESKCSIAFLLSPQRKQANGLGFDLEDGLVFRREKKGAKVTLLESP